MGASWLSRVETLYQEYIQKAEELEKNRKIGDGLFGLTPGPADDPCHERFARELEEMLKACADSASGPEAAEILRFQFRAPQAHEEPKSLYWILIAVQGLGGALVDCLSPEEAAGLAAEYGALYPRRLRLPVQKQLLKSLERKAR